MTLSYYNDFMCGYKPIQMTLFGEEPSLDKDLERKILKVLGERFSSGIHATSFIAQENLKSEFSALFPQECIPESFDLKEFITPHSVCYQNVYYVVPESAKVQLIEHIEIEIKIGYRIFYYETIYEVHKEFLNEIHIYSSDILKLQLERFFPQYFFSPIFFPP